LALIFFLGLIIYVWFKVGMLTHAHIVKTDSLGVLYPPPPGSCLRSEEYADWFVRQTKNHQRYVLCWPAYWFYAWPRYLLMNRRARR
jgi:hypothetical protein